MVERLEVVLPQRHDQFDERLPGRTGRRVDAAGDDGFAVLASNPELCPSSVGLDVDAEAWSAV